MWAHLWTKGPQPWAYMELILCRDVYHCTPAELAQVPLATILDHLACMDVEAKVKQRRAKKR